MAGGQNFESASDATGGMPTVNTDALFEDLPKEMLRLFKEVESYVGRISKEWSQTVKETTDAVNGVGGNKTGGGRLGLGSMSRNEKLGVGLGVAAVGVGTLMKMAPNTMSAVTQRLGADSYAFASGMSSRAAILQANRQVGGGATSAMGPTMAAMNLAYSGYTANSASSRNIMSQISGLSAQSGMTNEDAASSVAGMNGMMFLRAGIRIRDSQGNLKPVDQIINQVYNFLYRGRQIDSEEAQLVYQPNSRAYSTIAQLAGNDPNLIQQIQAGIVARTRAKSSKAYSAAMTSKDPNKMLDLMGVDKSSTTRSNFNYQSSEARKLAATETGLVGGYNVALNSTAAVNNGFSTLAEALPGVTNALMGFKGALETFPGAGNTGGTIASLFSSGMGLATSALEAKYIGKTFGGGGGGKNGFNLGGKSLLKAGAYSIGASLVGDAVAGDSDKGSGRSRAGNALKYAGIGASIGSFFPGWGTAIGAGIGAVYGAATGGERGDAGNLGVAGGNSAYSGDGYALPVPRATPVTSAFGPRDNSQHPNISKFHKGIDYGVPEGSAVFAAGDGVVAEVGSRGSYGTFILIKHADGRTTRYAHLKQTLVSRGDRIVAGQLIARSGGKPGTKGAGNSTGPHLHFEMTDKNGVKINPQPILSGKSAPNPKSSGAVDPTLAGKDRAAKNFGSGKRVRSLTDISVKNASSPTISSLIDTFATGEPKSWSDILKKVPEKDREKFLASIPDTYDGPVTTDKKSLMRTLASRGFNGKALRTAYAVSIAESGGRSNAVGDEMLQNEKWGPSIGLFQIRSLKDWKKWNDPYRDAKRLPDPSYNTDAALKKSKQGANWKPWTTYTQGSYLKHLAEADSMAANVGVGGGQESVNLPSSFASSAAMGNSSITISGGRSSAGSVNVHLNMNVTISHGSVQEADRLVRLVGEKLKNDLTLKQIAGSL
jgi:murein DD-endopeptidase MepM/ murein hydrolase activator NlpD